VDIVFIELSEKPKGAAVGLPILAGESSNLAIMAAGSSASTDRQRVR
jgi:hypothetical protein